MLTRISRSRAAAPLSLTLALAHLVALSPTLAVAQSAPRPAATTSATKPLSETLTGEAKANYDVAVTLYRDKDYTNASARFKQAYDLSKDPRLLWNMAACQKALRHYSEVQTLVNQYVTLGGGEGLLTDADKREAEQLLSVIDTLVAPLKIDVAEPGAQISIDGNVVATTPVDKPLMVDMGPHHVKITKADFADYEQDINVTAGKTASIKTTLVKHSHEGRVSVRTSEKNAVITLDNKTVGSFEWFGPASVGPHLLRVNAAGYEKWQADFTITEGAVRTFEVTLKAEKKPIPLWVWIGGGVLLAGGLAAASVGAAIATRGNECGKDATPATCPVGTFSALSSFDIGSKKITPRRLVRARGVVRGGCSYLQSMAATATSYTSPWETRNATVPLPLSSMTPWG